MNNVNRILFYSLDINLRECGKLYQYNNVYEFRYMFKPYHAFSGELHRVDNLSGNT